MGIINEQLVCMRGTPSNPEATILLLAGVSKYVSQSLWEKST